VIASQDRPGYIRAAAVEGRIASLERTGRRNGGVSVVVLPPGTEVAPETGLCRLVAEYLFVYGGASQTAVEKNVTRNVPKIPSRDEASNTASSRSARSASNGRTDDQRAPPPRRSSSRVVVDQVRLGAPSVEVRGLRYFSSIAGRIAALLAGARRLGLSCCLRSRRRGDRTPGPPRVVRRARDDAPRRR
jgi:hypothetical protein